VTRLTTCADAEAVAERVAAEVLRHMQAAGAERRAAHVALAGGSSPRRAYELLAREPAEWERAHVWFADERCVGPAEDESNYRMVDEALLRPANIGPERIHRMEGELGPEEGAHRYARELLDAIPASSPPAGERSAPVLDVIVLGIGEDGHVASLFPDAHTLDAGPESVCLGIHDSPKPPPERITLSMPVLRAARRCVLLATGAGKAGAIRAMLAEPSRHLPASLLERGRLTVIVDDAAAPGAQAR
jgi:6-phosphogluconolactonase